MVFRAPAELPTLIELTEARAGALRSLSPAGTFRLARDQGVEVAAAEHAGTASSCSEGPTRGSSQASSMPDKRIAPTYELMIRVREAFHQCGYDGLTMIEIAKHCGFTRRALYFYFRSKEEALRGVVAYFNDVAIRQGFEAGDAVRKSGGSGADILAEILDIRYGETRRRASRSPYLVELNGEIFRRCHDLMVESALVFHRELEAFIRALVADGLLALKPDVSPGDLARLLADGARGVNQTLPPLSADEFSPRYRALTRAILYGSATEAVPHAAEPRSSKRSRDDRGQKQVGARSAAGSDSG